MEKRLKFFFSRSQRDTNLKITTTVVDSKRFWQQLLRKDLVGVWIFSHPLVLKKIFLEINLFQFSGERLSCEINKYLSRIHIVTFLPP